MFRSAARTTLFATIALVAIAVLAPAAQAACADTWDGGAGTSDWTTGTNWVSNVAPALVDTSIDICVRDTAVAPVLSGQTVSYRSLTLEADAALTTSMSSLTVTDAIVLGPGARMQVDGQLGAEDLELLAGAELETWGAAVNLEDGATMTGTGTWIVFDSGFATSLGAGTNTTFSIDGPTVDVFGELDVKNWDVTLASGTMQVNGAAEVSDLSSGSLTVASGATIANLAGGGDGTISAHLVNHGTVRVDGGALVVSGNNMAAPVDTGTYDTSGGTIEFTGYRGVGDIDVVGSSYLSVNGTSLELSGTVIVGAGAGVEITGTGGSIVSNGAAVRTIEGASADCTTCELRLAGGTYVSGDLVVGAGIQVEHTGDVLVGEHTLAPLTLEGTWDVGSSARLLPNTVSSAFEIAESGELTSDCSACSLETGIVVTNNGTISASGTGTTFTISELTNLSVGVLTDGAYHVSGGAKLDLPGAITTNAATIVQDGPGSRLRDALDALALAPLATNSGSLTLTTPGTAVSQGTASPLTSTGTLVVGSGYTIGTTLLVTAGTLELAGSVSGVLSVGASATLAVDVAGTSAGQYTSGTVTGAATIDGVISVDATGYVPVGTDSVQVLAAGSATGTPGAVSVSSIATPWTFAASITGGATPGLVLAATEAELPGTPGTPTSSSHSGAGGVTDTTIDASWSAASDGTGSGVAGYSIEFSQVATTTPDAIADTTATSSSSAALAPGTWYLHVRAIDGEGNAGTAAHSSALVVSPEATTTTTTTTAAADTTAPSAPGTPSSSSHSSTRITFDRTVDVAWAAASDAVGVTGYSVEFSRSATTTPDATSDTSGLTATSAALAEGWWYVHVRALDAAGNAGDPAHSARLYVGVRATGCTAGGATILRATGTAAANRIIGTTRRDTLRGLGGNDTLVGRAGNDRLDGGTGNDRLCGDAGNDTIVGGAGRDTVVAGAGRDSINVRDGRRGDVVSCGSGRDVVRIDRGDRTIGCEVVRYR